LVDEGRLVELLALAKDGKAVWVELSLSALGEPTDDGRYGLALIRDITERKRAGEERMGPAPAQTARVKAEEQADAHLRLNAELRELVSERDAALAEAKRASTQV